MSNRGLSEDDRGVVRRLPLFAGLGEVEYSALERHLRPRRLAAGEVLFRHGDPGDALFVVSVGELTVGVTRPTGRVAELGRIVPGEVVGEMSLFDPAPRSLTVAATEPTLVLELSRRSLAALRADAPSAAAALVGEVIRDVTRRLREVDERLARELDGAPSGGDPIAPSPSSKEAEQPVDARPERGGRLWKLLDRLRGRR